MNFDVVYGGPSTVNPPRFTLVTAPAVEPLLRTDDVVQQCLRLDPNADDTAYQTLVLTGVRKYFERVTGLSLISQQWKVKFDDLPSRAANYGIDYSAVPLLSRGATMSIGREIIIPRAPLISVDSFQYLDSSGQLQTFASTNYTVGSVGVATGFARLWLNDGADWPTIGSFPGAIQITFTAGFGAAGTDVPEDVRIALLMLAAHWYENRLPVSADGLAGVPNQLADLIAMHRVSDVA